MYGGVWHEAKMAFVEKYTCTVILWFLVILGIKVVGKVIDNVYDVFLVRIR